MERTGKGGLWIFQKIIWINIFREKLGGSEPAYLHFCIHMGRGSFLNWMIFILLSVIWGSSFILMKKSADHLSGVQIGAVRVLAAGLVLLPLGLVNLFRIPRGKVLLVLLTGLLGTFFPAFLFAVAIEHNVDSSFAGILNSLTPLFVVTIGIVFFRSIVSRRKIMGVLAGFAGLVVLSLSRGSLSLESWGYTLLILLGTLLYGINVNLVSHRLREVPPMQMASVSLSFIALPAAYICWRQQIFSMFAYDEASRWSIAASALLGIVGTALATALFYVLIKRAGGLFASLVTYGIPVISILWGLWDNEQVSLLQVGCLGMILGGVYIANK